MAGGRGYYAVERVARRDGYVMGDVDGRVPGGGSADAEGEGGNGRGPEVLGSTVVGEGVLGRWQDGVPVCVCLAPLLTHSLPLRWETGKGEIVRNGEG